MHKISLPLIAATFACTSTMSALGADLGKMAAPDLARMQARTICSCIFAQRMTMAQCTDGRAGIWRYASTEDSPVLLSAPDQRLDVSIEPGGASVRLLAGSKVVASSRYLADGGGCVTSLDDRNAVHSAASPPSRAEERISPALPRGPLPAGVDAKRIATILDDGFSSAGPLRGYARAAVIVANGRVVADRYAPGYGAHNLYYSGSIAKVLNNLLAGLLVRDGKLRVNEPVNLPQWRGDGRARITYDHLLKMVSGIDWEEEFFVPQGPGYAIYFAGTGGLDIVRYMSARPLEAEPGTHLEYSTGSATLLGAMLQAKLDTPTRAGLLQYLERELFTPLDAQQVVLEFDPAGHPLTGHAMPIGAEDLARFGMLLLNDGVWNSKRVLPEGWVAYSTRAALQSDRSYGAQLMLDAFDLPGCYGHSGVGENRLLVCPERDIVVVWLSSMFNFTGSIPDDGSAEMVQRIVAEFPKRSTGSLALRPAHSAASK